MTKYLVTLDAQIYVTVEANDELKALAVAYVEWRKEDVKIIDVNLIESLQDDQYPPQR